MTDPIRLADHDWLSAPTDTPANARFEGLIDPSGVTTIAQLGFWPWDAYPAQAAAAQVRLLDADGLLDVAAQADLSGQAVELLQAPLEGALASATPVARYVVDKLTVDSDSRKTLTLRDAHDDLDKTINPGTFADTVTGYAGQTQPLAIGAVFNAPVLLTGSDGSVGWLADAPQAVALLRDRGDPMEAGTYSMDAYDQQVLLVSPPLGPMTANLSSIASVDGEPVPATLEQALRDVMRRAGISAWSSADAAAIDTATGYAGIGYYAAQQVDARQALAAILPSYGAWYWQDASGVLRISRIVDPAGLAVDFELDDVDLAEDLAPSTDTAAALSSRMSWRPNARPMRESEFVTDLVDVPHELRAQLSADYAGVVAAAGADTLPAEYRHALEAEPFPSRFWAEEDAQAEIDRVVGLYQAVRRFFNARLRGMPTLAPLPGQVCRLTYPRHGLEAGRKLLVRKVERNPVTGDLSLILWG